MTPIEAIDKARIEAAAEVLCDATGWPLIDCRYVARLMIKAADNTIHAEVDDGGPVGNEFGAKP